MDFFESQDIARRKTSLLVVYYIIAVALIIVALFNAYRPLAIILIIVPGSRMNSRGLRITIIPAIMYITILNGNMMFVILS